MKNHSIGIHIICTLISFIMAIIYFIHENFCQKYNILWFILQIDKSTACIPKIIRLFLLITNLQKQLYTHIVSIILYST